MDPTDLVNELMLTHAFERKAEQQRQLEAQYRAFADHLRWSEDGRRAIGSMLSLDPDDFQASRKGDTVRLLLGRDLWDGEPVAAFATTASNGVGYGIRIGSEGFGLMAVSARNQARAVLAAALGLQLRYEPTDLTAQWAGSDVVVNGTAGAHISLRPMEGGEVIEHSFQALATELTFHLPIHTPKENAA